MQFPFGLPHNFGERGLRSRFVPGGEDEPHPTAGHTSQHPEAPEIFAKLLADPRNDGFGVKVGGPRNDRLERAEEIARGGGGNALDISRLESGNDFVQDACGFLPSLPLGGGTE